MRFIGLILSVLILSGTGVLVWQHGGSENTLVIRPAPTPVPA